MLRLRRPAYSPQEQTHAEDHPVPLVRQGGRGGRRVLRFRLSRFAGLAAEAPNHRKWRANLDLMPAFDKTELRDQPAYGLAEAARYLRLPAATLRSWVVGRPYPRGDGVAHFQPLIPLRQRQPPTLSFWNLIEAHVLRSLRTDHGVSIQALRKSLSFAEKTLSVTRLLLSQELRTHGGRLLLDHYGELIDLSASGQLAMRKMLEAHLERVEWDEWRFPVRLYPFVSSHAYEATRPIAIDPKIAFGRPVVVRTGVSTRAISERIDAGESIEELKLDYDLSQPEIEEAVLYERAA